MQINHYWHGQEFKSLEGMIDPIQNVTYAVKFLQQLHKQHGSWAEAVKHYHSPDETRGKRYFSGFSTAVDTLKSTSSNPTAKLATAPTHYEFFHLGSPRHGKIDMGVQLATKAEISMTKSSSMDPEYARLIASLGATVNTNQLIMPLTSNDMAKPSQVRGVLRNKWAEVESLRRSLAVD
jgi:hypothetical protein